MFGRKSARWYGYKGEQDTIPCSWEALSWVRKADMHPDSIKYGTEDLLVYV